MSIAIEPLTEKELPERYEVINGEIVEAPPMSWFAAEVANRIHDELGVYLKSNPIGRVRMDMMFHVPISSDPGRNRRPDVAFIRFDRWPAERIIPYRGEPAEVIPDLVVEVASPNDKADALLMKAYEFLEAGVRLVWLVFPGVRVVHAYESPDSLRRFKGTDELDGGTILPGFRVQMSSLFPPVTDVGLPDDE